MCLSYWTSRRSRSLSYDLAEAHAEIELLWIESRLRNVEDRVCIVCWRKLLQAHLDLRQPGKAVEPVRDAAGAPAHAHPGPYAAAGRAIFGEVEVARTGYGAGGHPVCTRWTAR